MRFFWSVATIFFLLHLLTFPVFASTPAEFTTSLSATYSITQRGVTTVKNEIHIKNNFSSIYATQYALEVSSKNITNIHVYTLDQKPLSFTTAQTDTKTTVAFKFLDKIIGKDQERVFVIEYQHPDVALLTGNVLEIDVPKLIQQDAFQSYTVRIEVPSQFSTIASATPGSFTKEDTDLAHMFTFSTNAQQGINLIFGDKQTLSFTLKYHVANPSISQGELQVALPPDTAFQRVQFTAITPQPDTITKDIDGNWIGTFTVGSQKELEVVAQGLVTVYMKPTVPVPKEKVDKTLLADQRYWEVSNPEIQQRAKALQTPHAIYDYVVKTLTYSYDRLNQSSQSRRGAVEALHHPDQSLCQEFTDTFIALSRAAGIQAREVNGFAFTQNTTLRPLSLVADVLHAWPEYYDAQSRTWIPVDPTWGSTTGGVDFFKKMDFNHMTFAIHGHASDAPYPAGVYKIPGQEGKDVYVEIAPSSTDPPMDLAVTTNTTLKGTEVVVENLTGTAWYDVPVSVDTSPSLSLTKAWKNTIITLLPYQKERLQVGVTSSNLFASNTGTVRVTVGGRTVQYETRTKTFDAKTAVGLGLAAAAVIAGGVLVFRKKR